MFCPNCEQEFSAHEKWKPRKCPNCFYGQAFKHCTDCGRRFLFGPEQREDGKNVTATTCFWCIGALKLEREENKREWLETLRYDLEHPE